MAMLTIPRAVLLSMGAATILLGVDSKRSTIPTFAGHYITYGEKFTQCLLNGAPPLYQWVVRPTRFNPYKPNQKQNITGYINGSAAFDDTWGAHVDMALRNNNQWKEHALVQKFPHSACSAFRTNIPDFFRIIFKSLGDYMDARKKCVIPGGTYEFNSEPINWVFPNFPILPYGHYRFTLIAGAERGRRPLACLQCECFIIPKTD